MLSDELWRQLGADPALLGRIIQLNDRAYQVVGILSAGFRAPNQFELPDVPIALYTPLVFTPADLSPSGRGDHDLGVVARLKGGVTLAQAQADLDGVFF